MKRKRKRKSAVSRKISVLVREGVPQRRAVAESLSMQRAHRLTKTGGYIRAGKKRKRRGSRRRTRA